MSFLLRPLRVVYLPMCIFLQVESLYLVLLAELPKKSSYNISWLLSQLLSSLDAKSRLTEPPDLLKKNCLCATQNEGSYHRILGTYQQPIAQFLALFAFPTLKLEGLEPSAKVTTTTTRNTYQREVASEFSVGRATMRSYNGAWLHY